MVRRYEDGWKGGAESRVFTQRLYIILIEAALNVLDHQACLSDLRVSNHTDFDDDAGRVEVSDSLDTCKEANLFLSSPFSAF